MRHATSRWSALILPPLPLSGNISWRVLVKTIGQSSFPLDGFDFRDKITIFSTQANVSTSQRLSSYVIAKKARLPSAALERIYFSTAHISVQMWRLIAIPNVVVNGNLLLVISYDGCL
jgi:hypothetical protein